MRPRYPVELLERHGCGADVATFRFSRPEELEFRAGQWLTLELVVDGGPIAETFTICSAPVDEYLEFTTRLSGSAYKNALSGLAPGDSAFVAGPGGRLSLPPGESRLAFLVGGVGITPVRSMLRQACAKGARFDDAVVFFGNRDASCVPFADEFSAMAAHGVRTVVCIEHPSRDWGGESGFINAQIVRRHLPVDDGRPYFVTGPPPMVAAMEGVLDDLSVPGSLRIIERFGARVT